MTLLGQLQELTLGVPLVSGFSGNFRRLGFRLKVLETCPVCSVCNCLQINVLQHASCTADSKSCQKPPEKTLHQNFLSRLKFMAIVV